MVDPNADTMLDTKVNTYEITTQSKYMLEPKADSVLSAGLDAKNMLGL